MCGFQGTRNRRRSAYCAESFQDGGFGYKVTKLKPRKRRTAQTLHRFPVTMAKGIHLFPCRTQKLSLSAPMVLGWRRPGRVGRCRIPQRKASDECLGLFLCVSGEILLPAHLRRSQRTYLVRFIPVRRLWRKQHGDEHLGEQEAERRSNFVHLKKSSFQIIPTNVRHCTWLGFFLPPAVRDFRQGKSHGRAGGRTRKKRFSFRLQRPKAPVIFDEVRECT